MSKTTTSVMLDLQAKALSGDLGDDIKFLAEQNLMSGNEMVSRMMERESIKKRDKDSLKSSIQFREALIEGAKSKLYMMQTALALCEQTEAIINPPQKE